MNLSSTVKDLLGVSRGVTSIRYRAVRGLVGVAAWILVMFGIRQAFTLPGAVDQAFWPFLWIASVAIFAYLLLR